GRVARRDLDPAGHQPFADGQPDAADPACDEGDLPVHVSHGDTHPFTYLLGASPRAGYRRLPIAGGFMCAPARASDHSVQSCHQDPLCLVTAPHQAAGSLAVSSPVSSQALAPGGLTMPAMCPPLDST